MRPGLQPELSGVITNLLSYGTENDARVKVSNVYLSSKHCHRLEMARVNPEVCKNVKMEAKLEDINC